MLSTRYFFLRKHISNIGSPQLDQNVKRLYKYKQYNRKNKKAPFGVLSFLMQFIVSLRAGQGNQFSTEVRVGHVFVERKHGAFDSFERQAFKVLVNPTGG